MISNKPKSKQRYLSPSFKKGAIKKEKDKEEEFKLNLILNGADDSESPKSPKKAGKRLSLQTDQRQNITSPQPKMPSKKHKSVVDKAIIDITSKTNNISLGNKIDEAVDAESEDNNDSVESSSENKKEFDVIEVEQGEQFEVLSSLGGKNVNTGNDTKKRNSKQIADNLKQMLSRIQQRKSELLNYRKTINEKLEKIGVKIR